MKCAKVSLCLVWALVVGQVDMVCMATLDMVDTDHSLAAPLMVGRVLHQNLAVPQGQEGEAEVSLEAEVGDILEAEVEDTQEVGGGYAMATAVLPSSSCCWKPVITIILAIL